MRMTEYLKQMFTKSNEPQHIDSDGLHYTFIPGKNGSLTAPVEKKEPFSQLDEPRPKTGKVIGPVKEAAVGSTRG